MPVYLFEYFSDERAKLAAEQEQARQAKRDAAAPFLKRVEAEKAKAAKEGRTFLDEGPVMIKVPTVMTPIPEQWAVLVGGYKTNEQARKAVDAVHKWAPPSDTRLMDKATAMNRQVTKDADKLVVDNVVDVNPYPTAMCVKNPSLPKASAEPPPDPRLWKWNEAEPLSVLNCKKPYTLVVKAFTMPVVASGLGQEPSVMQSGKKPGDESSKRLVVTAAQAQNLANMLRSLKDKDGQPAGYESYVLHLQTGSIVCVGQFDREDDPGMAAVVHRLTTFSLKMSSDASGQQFVRPGERSFFDQISVLKIPRR
jgi:hypothetical protein